MLLTPYFFENRGNSTTAKRISSGLQQNGLDVTVFAYDEATATSIDEIQQAADCCDLIHIIHFYRFTKWLKKTNFQLKKPYILTSGGTDVNQNLYNKANRTEMEALIQEAKVITVFTNDAKEKLFNAYHHLKLRIEVIPQSVWFPTHEVNGFDFNLPKGYPAILLPAGLRKVKDIFFLMDELRILKKKYLHLQFVIAGVVLDEKIYEKLRTYIKKYAWVHFFENVPLEKMVSLYEWADVVLNTSISEGQSSALLEAMDRGCIILGRNNPGNASMIHDGINGFLFEDGHDFLKKFESILNDDAQAETIIENGKSYVWANHRFEDEIVAFIKLYEQCLH